MKVSNMQPSFRPGEDFRRPPEGPADEEQEGQDREQEGARQGEGHPEVRAGLAQRRRNGQKGAGHQGLLCGRRQERPGQGAVRQGKGDLRSLRESGAQHAFVVIHGAGHPPKDSSCLFLYSSFCAQGQGRLHLRPG